MAFVQGFKLQGGTLGGKAFEFVALNTDDYSWRIAPFVPQGNFAQFAIDGSDSGDFGGIPFNPVTLAVSGWGNRQFMGALEVKNANYYKEEMRFYCDRSVDTGTGDQHDFWWRISVDLRIYTDATTYTDTTLVQCPEIRYLVGSDGVTRKNVIVFGNIVYDGHHYIILGEEEQFSPSYDPSGFIWIGEFYGAEYNNFFTNLIGGEIPSEYSSPEFGDASEPEGGYNEIGGYPKGTFDFSSDEIPIDAKPTLGVTSAGFINVYKIEINDLQDLGEKLFPHFLPAELLADPAKLTTPEMLAVMLKSIFGAMISPVGTTIELADNLGIVDILMNGKLIDYVLDCHVIPTSISGSVISPLKIGYRTFTDYQLAKATEDYVDIDCGTLNLKECFCNFLDYNCKAEIYLPFVGFVPLPPEYWNNATLQVHYRFNIIDGSFQVRLVTSRDNDGKPCVLHNSVIAQYGGVCCVHFPITGLQYSNVVAGLVNGTAGAVEKGMGGSIAGVATNLMNMAMLRPNAPSSNGYNASSSFLGQKTPYLVIKRPAPQFSENYPHEVGLPLNVYYKLSNLSGMTVIDNPVLNMQCTENEYKEIVSLMKEGIIL